MSQIRRTTSSWTICSRQFGIPLRTAGRCHTSQ
ncbi:hypothetical protein ACHAWF_009121 [Thalassiosira exigua]